MYAEFPRRGREATVRICCHQEMMYGVVLGGMDAIKSDKWGDRDVRLTMCNYRFSNLAGMTARRWD